jgi:ribosome-associated toxin RatA of RatAB toxin-antitoxin module
LMYNLNMSTIILNRTNSGIIGASLFVPAPARHLYEAVLDVRSFPSWAPGVRRVEITEGPVGPGMVSEWEVSVLGIRRRISSVLVKAEDLSFLRWTYDGLVSGWGECAIEDWGNGTLAKFRTELQPTESCLEKLMRTLPFRNAARSHLKRCLVQLGQAVSGNRDGVRVGPLEISHQPSAVSRQLLCDQRMPAARDGA